MQETKIDRPKALLVSIKTPEISEVEAEESLLELERLVTTLGFDVVAKESQNRNNTTSSMAVGEGKLKILAQHTGGKGYIERAAFAKKSKAALKFDDNQEGDEDQGPELDSHDIFSPEETADVTVFDCDLTPSQMRNLETALGTEVLDRSGVIIEIFSRHANTRTARLQVEIARLNYLAPRLRETGGPSERQAGQGSGETSIELDKRNIRHRVTELKRELELVQKKQEGRRMQRSEQLTVALVGYTNAGKSSTMRALTGSQVLVEDKLFATLDTTVRALSPETSPRVLITDTVGFIKKLPHDLVASFKSTLDEALHASLLLYVVDASDPTFTSQLEVTHEVLGEVGAKDTPSFVVLNKSDQLSAEQQSQLKKEFPLAVLMSSRNPDDIKILRDKIMEVFEKDMIEEDIFAPYTLKGIVGEIRSNMRVVGEKFKNEGVLYTVRARPNDLKRLKKKYEILE